MLLVSKATLPDCQLRLYVYTIKKIYTILNSHPYSCAINQQRNRCCVCCFRISTNKVCIPHAQNRLEKCRNRFENMRLYERRVWRERNKPINDQFLKLSYSHLFHSIVWHILYVEYNFLVSNTRDSMRSWRKKQLFNALMQVYMIFCRVQDF